MALPYLKPERKSDQIKRVWESDMHGQGTIGELARRCLLRGVWTVEERSGWEYRQAEERVRKVMKELLPSGLPSGLPVDPKGTDPNWAKPSLLTYEQLSLNIEFEFDNERADITRTLGLVDFCDSKYGRHPDLPAWLNRGSM